MKPISMFIINKGIPIPPKCKIRFSWRARALKHKFEIMEIGDSIVLPYCRQTVVDNIPDNINIVCRQLNDYQFQYWRKK